MAVPGFMTQWVQEARRRLGTRGWDMGEGQESAVVDIKSPYTAVDFPAGTQLGRVRLAHSWGDRKPGKVTDLIHQIVARNPQVPAFLLQLPPKEVKDIEGALGGHTAKDGAKRKYFVAGCEGGGILFSSGKPLPGEMKEKGFVDKQVFHEENNISCPNPERVLPTLPFPTRSGLSFGTASVEGLTTPVAYSSAGLPLMLPIQAPLPWVGFTDPIVPGPTGEVPLNKDPGVLDQAEHCLWEGGVFTAEQLQAMQREAVAVPFPEWSPIFNHNFPSPGRPPDPPNRRMLALEGVGDEESDIVTRPLPALNDAVQTVVKLLDEQYGGEHTPYSAGYVDVTGHVMQHPHRDMFVVPAGARTLSVFFTLGGDIVRTDGTSTYFVPGSRKGLPDPWVEVPIVLKEGGIFALYSDVVHAGGCIAKVEPPTNHRTIAFVGVSTKPTSYRWTMGVVPPPISPDVPVADRCAVHKCRRKSMAGAKCFVCGEAPLCAKHSGDTCSACESSTAAPCTAPPQTTLGGTVACFFPSATTSLYALLLPRPGPPPLGAPTEGTVRPESCPFLEISHEVEVHPLLSLRAPSFPFLSPCSSFCFARHASLPRLPSILPFAERSCVSNVSLGTDMCYGIWDMGSCARMEGTRKAT